MKKMKVKKSVKAGVKDMGYNMTPKYPKKKFASKAKVAKLKK